MEIKELVYTVFFVALILYALIEVDHFFPFRHYLFSRQKFIDYDVFTVLPTKYYFYYKPREGGKQKHYVTIKLVSVHENGKVYIKGYDETTNEHIRFNASRMSRVYKDESYVRVWYPREFFRRLAYDGERIRHGKIRRKS
jgi:hypothetical protein